MSLDSRLDPRPGLPVRLLVVFLRVFWRRRRRPAEPPTRFLVIRPDRRVGNLLITTALVRAIKQHFPEATVDMLVPLSRRDLLAGLREVEAFHVFDQGSWLRPWRLVALARRLRARRYDGVIDASHWQAYSLTAAILSRLAGGAFAVGPERPGSPTLHDDTVPLGLPEEGQWPAELLMKCRLLRAWDVEVTEPEMICPLGQDSEAVEQARSWWSGRAEAGNRHLIWATTRKTMTQLSPEQWVLALASLPELRDGLFALGWGPGEEAQLAELTAALQAAGYQVEALPPTDLEQLAAFMVQADTVLSGDTGPMHLALALGRPMRAFFRAGDGARWCPTGPTVRRFRNAGAGYIEEVDP